MADPTLTSTQIQTLMEAKDYAPAAQALLASIHASQTTTAWQEAALGTSQHFLGEAGGAVTHLQNAVLLDRFNSSYRSNLTLARSQVEGGLGESMGHPADWGFELATWIRPKEAASLAFLLLNLFLLLRFIKKPLIKRDLALGALVLILLTIGALGFYGADVGVLTQVTNLKRNPVESAADIRSLPAGARVRRIRDSGEFSEVERSDAFRGWVKKDTLRTFY